MTLSNHSFSYDDTGFICFVKLLAQNDNKVNFEQDEQNVLSRE